MKLPKTIVAGLVAGATLVGSAWAGVGLVPIGTTDDVGEDATTELVEGEIVIGEDVDPDTWTGARVGASKVSMTPRPDDYLEQYPDAYWETDADKCATLSEAAFEQMAGAPAEHGGHYVTPGGSPWPENPNCIYSGGFGIGPMNPLTAFDTEYGLWVRSVAIGDGADTVVLTIIDAEGYLWDYRTKCERCGAKQLAEDLGAELTIPKQNFVIASTHAHSSPDLIGGWGFVPDWYMTQVSDAIRQSVREAVANMVPAQIEVGEVEARAHNRERRDTYRSAEEQQLTWLRAFKPGTTEAIATVGAYAAHPVSEGAGPMAHADWPATFERGVEEEGGVGLLFMTGLGNMSTSGGRAIGTRLAALVPPVGAGIPLTDTNVRAAQEQWNQPATNVPLTALGLPGFFDREFVAAPSSVTTGKSPDTAPCTSASAATVELPATAVRIGSQFALTASPGEVFSNLTNTIKEQSGALVTMPIAQANDALGYMPQSFELSPVGQQGLGFVAGGVLIVNYEDSYSIDRCVGDKVLETSISLLRSI